MFNKKKQPEVIQYTPPPSPIPRSFKYITIFLASGRSLRFNKVTNYYDDWAIVFDYVSESTGATCHAIFPFNMNIAGRSFAEEEQNG